MVYQIDETNKRLLWIGKDRTVRTLLRFFMAFGKERTQSIKFVCSDMWKPYLKVIVKKIPNALNILDSFHIMKKFSVALDKVRSTKPVNCCVKEKNQYLQKQNGCY